MRAGLAPLLQSKLASVVKVGCAGEAIAVAPQIKKRVQARLHTSGLAIGQSSMFGSSPEIFFDFKTLGEYTSISSCSDGMNIFSSGDNRSESLAQWHKSPRRAAW